MTAFSGRLVAQGDLADVPVDPRLLTTLGRDEALLTGVVPLQTKGALTLVGASDMSAAAASRPRLEKLFGPVSLTPMPRDLALRHVLDVERHNLTRLAETKVRAIESCRSLGGTRAKLIWIAGAALVVGVSLAALELVLQFVLFAAIVSLLATTGLRLSALIATLFRRFSEKESSQPNSPGCRTRLPSVSLLVPLFREEDIARRLVKRLGALDYPSDRLEICLIVEDDDHQTQKTLWRTALPQHIRVITVPQGSIRTKPRALNYALPLSRGDIIGIYDAEDAPDPQQLRDVAEVFAREGSEVACVQGILDFYNARTSWITRCFAIDYATWFRLILPGLDRMGLVVPLGGTTLFFRREAIEALGGWDAHNVTEDADLGLRLTRRGYRTVLVSSVTMEEATARPIAWIRQRSRWLKGYALTWLVHMRRPRALWGELGAWRFFGVQVLFLGTLMQYLLWPFLLIFWGLAFSPGAPLSDSVAGWPLGLLSLLFVAAELVVMLSGVIAVSRRGHRWLALWVPTMIFYFPLGVAAIYKAMFEAVFRPFYWDKTDHGGAGG